MEHSTLVLLAATVTVFSLAMYVLLDGFDLGVGVWLGLQPSQTMRNEMIEAIEPVWDGNETWLIMAGVALWAAFPVAYGTLLPAFYLPLIGMLLCLGLRGVSFEFREEASPQGRQRWDRVFCLGSLGAAFLQGMVLGGLLTGVAVQKGADANGPAWTYAGGPWDFVSSTSLLCGVLVVAAYMALGSAWLQLKTSGLLHQLSQQQHRWSMYGFAALVFIVLAKVLAGQPLLSETLALRWPLVVLALGLALIAGGVSMSKATAGRHGLLHYGWSAAAIGSVLGALIVLLWPHIVPFGITVDAASAPAGSLVFMLVGVVFVMPVVLSYTALSYWVFRTPVGERT
jgi:cytochrome d ubiquinol oxidase subunit II